jgi:hypothetical protein
VNKALMLGLGALIGVAALTVAASAQSPTPPTTRATATVGANFVDNGDGICDNFQSGARRGGGQGQGRGKGYGRGMGGGTHVGPQDGTGYGPGAQAGGGTCDGTGPKGRARGRK